MIAMVQLDTLNEGPICLSIPSIVAVMAAPVEAAEAGPIVDAEDLEPGEPGSVIPLASAGAPPVETAIWIAGKDEPFYVAGDYETVLAFLMEQAMILHRRASLSA